MDYTIAENWMSMYEKAWRGEDGIDLTAVFSDEARYKTSPYAEPITGFDAIEKFWKEAIRPGEQFTMTYELVALEGDIVVMRVDIDYAAPHKEHWKDLWIIQFDDDGLCFSFEEWPLAPPKV